MSFPWCCQLVGNANLDFDREVHNILCPVRDWERLRDGIEDLKRRKGGVEREVEAQLTEPLVEVKTEVKSWMENVDNLAEEVDVGLRPRATRWSCLSLCFCPSSYKLGEDVTHKLERVQELKTEREGWNGKYVIHVPFRTIMEKLLKDITDLGNIRADTENSVRQRELEPRMQRSRVVRQWMMDVDSLIVEVEEFLSSEVQPQVETCLDQVHEAPGDGQLQAKAGKMVARVCELRREQVQLKDNLVTWMPPAPVEEVLLPSSSSSSSLVGADANFSEVLAYLKDGTHQVIGMYGMGGIGKTALLGKINDYYLKNMDQQVDFDLLIWVVVSKDVDIYRIQKDIGVRLGFGVEGSPNRLPDDKRLRATTLSNALSQKKFLLMLDDVWKKLDLSDVGISIGKQKKSKVIFTTRKEDVCTDMGADRRVKVGFLNEESSRRLFCRSVCNEEIFQNEKICLCAEEIVKKCGGLPLALLTVGRAMANKSKIEMWNNISMSLDDFPGDIPGMEEHVLKLLKFSFDNLADDKMRSCLLFCCLFREDMEIITEQLVDYWMVEGLLGNDGVQNNLERLRAKGLMIISDLQAACLLEKGTGDGGTVKMHDAVRDMGIWLGDGGDGSHNHRFVSFAGKGLTEITIPDEWLQLERISLEGNDIKEVHLSVCTDHNNKLPNCGKLVTLLANGNSNLSGPQLDRLSQFLTPSLRVLDLACTSIDHLPKSPSLKALRFLDLRLTSIQELDLDNIPNLKVLHLCGTNKLVSIFKSETTIPIRNLQRLDLRRSTYNILKEERGQLRLEDLEAMHQLEELELTLLEWHQYKQYRLEKLWRSARLSKSTRHLEIRGNLTVDDISMAMRTMRNLNHLRLQECPHLEGKHIEIKGDYQLERLTSLYVWGFTLNLEAQAKGDRSRCLPLRHLRCLSFTSCPTLKNIAWVVQLPRLERLWVKNCGDIEELLLEPYAEGETNTTNTFLDLVQIYLKDLPKLKRISPIPLILPSLKWLSVAHCPLLKTISHVQIYSMHDKSKSPGNSSRRTKIYCERNWWEALEWNHEDMKSSWNPHFSWRPAEAWSAALGSLFVRLRLEKTLRGIKTSES